MNGLPGLRGGEGEEGQVECKFLNEALTSTSYLTKTEIPPAGRCTGDFHVGLSWICCSVSCFDPPLSRLNPPAYSPWLLSSAWGEGKAFGADRWPSSC